jgi:serine/threonine protein kinase
VDLTGVQLGQYRVVERLGVGGMAEVYKAYQPALDRYVVVKVIASDLGHDSVFLDQFEREAKTLARLEHPNILPVYDSGCYGNTPYLVTQYVREGTLAERMDRPLPVEEAVRIICQVGDALAYAHAMGFVHRDVKPSNVLFTKSGSALLADFGVAQALRSQDGTDDNQGVGGGTPDYMAPEQCAGKPVDGRADIYSMGVLLYGLLTGKRTGEQTLLTRSLSAVRIPQPLREVIACAAATRPDDRYEVVEDFVAAAQEALLKISGEYVEPPKLTHQSLEAVLIAVFILLGLGLGIYAMKLMADYRKLDTWMATAIGSVIWMGALTGSASCLLNAALLIFRDRTRPFSPALLGTVGLVLAGGAALIIPLSLGMELPSDASDSFLTTAKPVNAIGSELLCLLPGVLMLLAAAGLYTYHHRHSLLAVRQNIWRTRRVIQRKSFASAERRSRFITRRMRDAWIQSLAAVLLLVAASRILAYVAPSGSIISIMAVVIEVSLIVAGLFGLVALVVWYAFSHVTSASESFVERVPSQVLSDVEVRRARLEKAREYEARIREVITQTCEGPVRERLQSATERLDEWVVYLERLTVRMNELEHDSVIRRDRSTVPRAIDRLEARLVLDQDTDTGVKDAVRRTLVARQAQLRYLRALDRIMTQAELHSDETVAALGTIYSQVLLVDARDIQSGRAQRLRADIDEQVQALNDLLDAMVEVQERRQDALAQAGD